MPNCEYAVCHRRDSNAGLSEERGVQIEPESMGRRGLEPLWWCREEEDADGDVGDGRRGEEHRAEHLGERRRDGDEADDAEHAQAAQPAHRDTRRAVNVESESEDSDDERTRLAEHRASQGPSDYGQRGQETAE